MTDTEADREPTKDELESWERRAVRDIETRQWSLLLALRVAGENIDAALPAAARILRFVDPESEPWEPDEPPLNVVPMAKTRMQ